MNKQIRLLAEQARLSYLYDYDTDGHAMVCNEKDIERFAELIVRECADVATMNNHQWESAGSYVLKHFGVEE
jgi:hypothetical protein